jgi:hypothetical protein
MLKAKAKAARHPHSSSKQLNTIDRGGSPGIQAEELDATSKPTGKKYYIEVVDLKDSGDGGNTVDLPIPKSLYGQLPKIDF